LKEYRNRRILSILFAKLLLGKKVKLIVDGTILEVANLNRARTQRIKRFSGKAFWGKKKRNLYSEHYKEKVRFEEMYYGVLVMVVCDSEGVVYDLWFHPASYHEVRSLRIGCKFTDKAFQPSKQVEERDYLTCLPLWLRYRL